ncbi:MAG: hypothetical protein MUC88_08300 [Planctomycetes bacterium]|nr:hypothetical protein [Planctomycetota bacterium]
MSPATPKPLALGIRSLSLPTRPHPLSTGPRLLGLWTQAHTRPAAEPWSTPPPALHPAAPKPLTLGTRSLGLPTRSYPLSPGARLLGLQTLGHTRPAAEPWPTPPPALRPVRPKSAAHGTRPRCLLVRADPRPRPKPASAARSAPPRLRQNLAAGESKNHSGHDQ